MRVHTERNDNEVQPSNGHAASCLRSSSLFKCGTLRAVLVCRTYINTCQGGVYPYSQLRDNTQRMEGRNLINVYIARRHEYAVKVRCKGNTSSNPPRPVAASEFVSHLPFAQKNSSRSRLIRTDNQINYPQVEYVGSNSLPVVLIPYVYAFN